MPIFTGTLAQCLAHFAKTEFQGDKRAELAKFAKVIGESTIRRWFNQSQLPAGEAYIRTMYYLEHLGYELKEGKKPLPAEIQDAGRLLAFDIVTADDLLKAGNIPLTEGGKSALYGAFRGTRQFSAGRYAAFAKFAAPFKTRLEEKQRQTPKLLPLKGLTLGKVVAEFGRDPLPPLDLDSPLNGGPRGHDEIIDFVAKMSRVLLPLLEYTNSEKFTAAERQRVRDVAGKIDGKDVIFHTSTEYNCLCGERSRRENRQK